MMMEVIQFLKCLLCCLHSGSWDVLFPYVSPQGNIIPVGT
jgi:lauroyl/myristoyl acyltransferase